MFLLKSKAYCRVDFENQLPQVFLLNWSNNSLVSEQGECSFYLISFFKISIADLGFKKLFSGFDSTSFEKKMISLNLPSFQVLSHYPIGHGSLTILLVLKN